MQVIDHLHYFLNTSSVILNKEQNKILSFEDYQLHNYEMCDQRLTIIRRKAGTGKSYVINEITKIVS